MAQPTSFATIVISYQSRLIGNLRAETDVTEKRHVLNAFENELNAINGGIPKRQANVRTVLASAAGSDAITCTQSAAVDGTDTVVIGGTTLTAKTTPTTNAQFAIGATSTAMAANLAAAINANPTLQKIVWASSSGAVCTVYCVFPGPIGNLVAVTKTGNGIALASATLTGGSSDEVDSLQFGFTPT